MADAAVDLTTLAAAKAYLAGAGVTLPASATDAVLEALITAVSAELQSHLCRRIPSQDYEARLSGKGEPIIHLPNTPLTAIASLKISGVDVPEAQTGRDHGYVLARECIYLRGYFAERGVQNIEIAYTGGHAIIPLDLVRAVHEALRSIFADYGRAEPGAVRLKAGDHEIDFGGISALASGCVTPAITSMLKPHRRVVPC